MLVVDNTGKAKEAGQSKTAPPPPPRRSPHTALSQQQLAEEGQASAKTPPVLPPRQKSEVVQAQVSPTGVVTKTIRLRKGESEKTSA